MSIFPFKRFLFNQFKIQKKVSQTIRTATEKFKKRFLKQLERPLNIISFNPQLNPADCPLLFRLYLTIHAKSRNGFLSINDRKLFPSSLLQAFHQASWSMINVKRTDNHWMLYLYFRRSKFRCLLLCCMQPATNSTLHNLPAHSFMLQVSKNVCPNFSQKDAWE